MIDFDKLLSLLMVASHVLQDDSSHPILLLENALLYLGWFIVTLLLIWKSLVGKSYRRHPVALNSGGLIESRVVQSERAFATAWPIRLWVPLPVGWSCCKATDVRFVRRFQRSETFRCCWSVSVVERRIRESVPRTCVYWVKRCRFRSRSVTVLVPRPAARSCWLKR